MKSDLILFMFVCGMIAIAILNQPHIYENSQCENVIYRLKNPCDEKGFLEIIKELSVNDLNKRK